jgi:hypothetical protein
MWEVLETASRVAQKSRQVEIDQSALVHFSQKIFAQGIEVPRWDDLYHFRGGNAEETIAYLLVLDSLNFCFWPGRGKARWEIEYRSERLSGYFGLAAALKRAVESGIPLTKPDYLAQLTLDQLREALGGRGQLPLMDRRLQILNNVGQVLMNEYDGQFIKFLQGAGKSAVALARFLAEKLPSFLDVADYSGATVYFYKRAQIFAADLYGTFHGKDWGDLEDMNELTAFADYKLPQVLRHLGVFVYTPELAQKIDQKIHLEAGSPEEVEIRANTVWAVERIRREIERMGRELKAFEIDWILWNLGQDPAFKVKPYHRTVTIYY